MSKQQIAIIGSTGSIGTQALQVIDAHSDIFEVNTLTAHNNWELLARQAIAFNPDSVVITNEQYYSVLKDALKDTDVKVYAGIDAVTQVVALPSVDTVLSAIVGYAGLAPTVAAIKAGKRIALANKETLVVAGEVIMRLAQEFHTPIIPVDSEHSAIFQCLVGERAIIEKVILTASGGPFFGFSDQQLSKVTLEQALSHPNWVMGNKITIDSATLMNKGFEVIEAKWLFDLQPSQIEVLVHPSSVIHSMVQFEDGAIKAQMGVADMKQPIQYALTFPERMSINNERFSFVGKQLEFFAADTLLFPCLQMAYDAMKTGGSAPCVLNAANEIAVAKFLNREIVFTDIPKLIGKTLDRIEHVDNPTLEIYKEIDTRARAYALETKLNN